MSQRSQRKTLVRSVPYNHQVVLLGLRSGDCVLVESDPSERRNGKSRGRRQMIAVHAPEHVQVLIQAQPPVVDKSAPPDL